MHSTQVISSKETRMAKKHRKKASLRAQLCSSHQMSIEHLFSLL